jgi:hypothetical protein
MTFTAVISYAQTFGGPPSFGPDVLDNPIDGGLGILLGAGVAYGAKKLRDKRNQNKQDQNMED